MDKIHFKGIIARRGVVDFHTGWWKGVHCAIARCAAPVLSVDFRIDAVGWALAPEAG